MSSQIDLLSIAKTRHSCKAFDPSKKISGEDFEYLKSIMQLAPSSVNLQPWRMFHTNTEEGKIRIAKATQEKQPDNVAKILNASHVVVFSARKHLDRAYVEKVLTAEKEAGRFRSEESYQNRLDFVAKNVELAEHRGNTLAASQNQVFISVGTLLLGAAAIGIDAVPMGGFDADVLDAELGLEAQGLRATLIVPLGYRSDEDFNAVLPKARLKESDIFQEI